jgi:hypothetical protein
MNLKVSPMKRLLIVSVALILASCSQHASPAKKLRFDIDRSHGSLTWTKFDNASKLWTILHDSSEGRFKIVARCVAHFNNDTEMRKGPDVCTSAAGDTRKSNMFTGPNKDGFTSIEIWDNKLFFRRVVGVEIYSNLYEILTNQSM